MGLWGVTTAAGDKPKFLPVDSNASGSTGATSFFRFGN